MMISEDAQAPRPSQVTRRTLFYRGAAVAAIAAPLGILAACGSSSTGAAATPTPPTPTAAPQLPGLKDLSNQGVAFREIQADENAHVKTITDTLTKNGGPARPKPRFQGLEQSSIEQFAATARVLENTGVGAYLFAAPAIASKAYLAAAGSILTIEARHAGFLDVLLSQPISPNGAFDKSISQADIVAAVSPFINNLSGGDDPAGKLKDDWAILNLALLLEYLEAEYYNINVPKFFP